MFLSLHDSFYPLEIMVTKFVLVSCAFQDSKPLCPLPENLATDDSLQAQIAESHKRLADAMKGKDVQENLLKALRTLFSAITALCFVLFIVIYVSNMFAQSAVMPSTSGCPSFQDEHDMN